MTISRNLRHAGLAFLLWAVAYNVTAPLLPLFAAELGADSLQMGLVASAGSAGALLLVLPLSILSDRRGRRAALLTGWGLSAVGVLLMASATSWQGLLPGSFLSLAVAAALPTLNTLLLDEVTPAQQARAFALLYSAGPVGLLAGSVAGGYVAERYGLRAGVVLAGIACVAAALALLPLASGKPREAEAAPASRGSAALVASIFSPAHVVFAVLAALGFLFVSLPGNFIVPYLRNFGGQTLVATGLYYSLLAGAQLIWSLLFSVWPRWSARVQIGRPGQGIELPLGTLVAVAICLGANALFGLLLPLRITGGLSAALFLRGSQYALQSLGSSLSGDLVTAGPGRTTRLTFFNAAVGVGAMGAPVIAGWLYGIEAAYPFWLSGAAAGGGALVLVAAILYLPRRQPLPAISKAV